MTDRWIMAGAHAKVERLLRPRLTAALVAGALAAGGAMVVSMTGGSSTPPEPGCSGALRVVTASSFAEVLTALAPAVATGPNCARLDVQVADGRGAAAEVADQGADLWIPDDAAWAGTQARAVLAEAPAAGAGTVLAVSPFYLVTDPATAERVAGEGNGWLGLDRLVAAQTGIPPVTLALRDPAGSGDGLLAAGAAGEAVWIDAGMDASAQALARMMPVTRTVPGSEPALPRSLGEVGVVPEYALLPALRAGSPEESHTVIAPADHTAALRFSWFPSAAAAADPAKAAQLDRLREALTGAPAVEALGAAGLRRPSDTGPPGEPGSPLPAVTAPLYDVLAPHHVDHVFATWYPADRRADVLVAVDVSGSMNARVPGSSQRLIDLVKAGFADMGRQLPDDAELGLWEFGVQLAPPDDYQALLPSATLSPGHREQLDAAVQRLQARSAGTGLHDTMLAAYLAAQERHRDGVPSHVVVFTDGHNELDPGSLTLQQLTQRLVEAQDPQRPVRLTVAAFGDKPDVAPLKKALEPIDGYVSRLSTADAVGRAFLHVAAGGLHD